MKHIEPKDLPTKEVHQLLLGGVAPRPIALVSTISKDGAVNLSPFSFFNAFGANPPTVAFSPSTRGRDGTRKDTYYNLKATGECVIQAVTHAMVEQISLASAEYPSEVDEFIKSGLTPVPSDLVKPPRVEESPFQMECRMVQMVPLGDGPASGNLAICEVVKFHVAEDLFENGVIAPDRIDLVGRNSGNWYTRASGSAMFEVAKPLEKNGLGFDNLPEALLRSRVLTGNNLAQLANCETAPSDADLQTFLTDLVAEPPVEISPEAFERARRQKHYREMLRISLALTQGDPVHRCELVTRVALDEGDVDFGWKAALVAHPRTAK